MLAYERVGEISEGVRQILLSVARPGPWQYCRGKDRNYACWSLNERVMFVRIPPGGMVDRHADTKAKGKRLNIVLQTNTKCLNYTLNEIGAEAVVIETHLDEGCVFEFDATREHWATNEGTTPRIVLVETLP